jgi:hypothetical protein
MYEMNKLSKIISEADLFIHLGDNVEDVEILTRFFHGRSIFVRGNCDFWSSVPLEKTEIVEGKKFFICHGHKYDVKYSLLPLKKRAKELGVDIALYGHTHLASLQQEDKIWLFNPGSPSLPRDGFKSYGEIIIENKEIYPVIKTI